MTRATDRAVRALDKRFVPLRAAFPDRPPKGWLRAIREALGMTTTQYSARLGVSQPRIVALEKSEAEGTVTLETLRRAAEALDCRLVYAILPNRPLTDVLHERARLKADEQLQRVGHTMRLENQGIGDEKEERQRVLLADELIRGNLRRLWDEPE